MHWTVGITAALIAFLLGLLTLHLIGTSTGAVPFLIGTIVAILPVPVYVMMALWIDRFEQEPKWLLAVAFFWGACVAVGFSMIVNTIGTGVVEAAFGSETADLYGLSISAPIVEESAKAFALFILFFWKRDEFDGVLDGIVYASMIGLGFATTENIKYYAESVNEGRTLDTFIVRGMFSPYAHPLFTSMTGIGLGIASHAARRGVKVALPAVGFLLAIVLHSVWNTSLFLSDRLDDGLLALGMYFLVMVPVFTGALLVALFGILREGKILREQMAREVSSGRLSLEEYERLCSVRGRMTASMQTLFRRGPSAWRTRRHFHAAASELAFHRHRLSRRISREADASSAAEREAEHLRAFDDLHERIKTQEQGGRV